MFQTVQVKPNPAILILTLSSSCLGLMSFFALLKGMDAIACSPAQCTSSKGDLISNSAAHTVDMVGVCPLWLFTVYRLCYGLHWLQW